MQRLRFRPSFERLETRIQPAPLNPLGFASLGVLNASVAGTYTINTNGPNPVIRDPGNNVIFTGLISAGVAVFDFTSVTISNGVTVHATGANPVAILAQTTMTIDGTLDASGTSAVDFDALDPLLPPQPNPGGAGGGAGGRGNANPNGNGEDNGFNGGGAGPGAGNQGGEIDALTGRLADGVGGAGGAGFGGTGARGASALDGATGATDTGGAAGAAYGNLFTTLQGGSGGGGANATGGGGGGGGVELGAITQLTITVNGLVDVHGGSGAVGNTAGSGGGSGGGILIHARTVTLNGTLDAHGGDGGVGPTVSDATGNGGGGGGGRVYVFVATAFNNNGVINIQGGASGVSDPGNVDFGIPPNTFGPGVSGPDASGGTGTLITLAPVSRQAVRVYYPTRYTYNPRTGIYGGFITLLNVTQTTITAPFSIAFTHLPPGVTWTNATNSTTGSDVFGGVGGIPSGTPFIVFNTDLPPNTPIRIYVTFTNPLHRSLSTFFVGYPVLIYQGLLF